MIEDILEPNPNWKTLPAPDAGDIVQLKHRSGFTHLVKVIVSSVTDGKVTGVVEAVYDWSSKYPITGGPVLNLVNKELTFPKDVMHAVIKKPPDQK